MIILSSHDLYVVKIVTLIADYDQRTLVNLYQPIIGSTAVALYNYLVAEAENQKVFGPSDHESLLIHMQLSTAEFIDARKMLEAVGLVKSYRSGANDEIKNYEYMIYAPKTPRAFFDDALLYGTLIKYVGEKAAKKLNTVYRLSLKEAEGEDISATFGEVFHPDFTDPAYSKVLNIEKAQGRKTAKIDSEFNYDSFFEALSSISQIKQSAITKKELKEIERLATLYDVDEVNIASIVANIYEPTFEKGKRIDFKKMSEILHDEANYAFLSKRTRKGTVSRMASDTDVANKIYLMESKTPKDFLTLLQNGTQPAEPDLRLVDNLSEQFHLTNGVINALIDFVLATNGNILPKALCQKIAASLVRENITTALDAMNFLKKMNKESKKKTQTPRVVTQTKETTKEEEATKEGEDVVDWDELMSHMED